MSSRFLDEILPGFYSCAERPENWQPVLDRIRDELEVGSVVIQLFRLEKESFKTRWEVRDSLSTERAELHDRLVNNEQNPRYDPSVLSRVLAQQPVVRDEDRFDLNCPRFSAFRERLRQAGLGRAITLDLKYLEDTHLSMTLHRHCDDARDFNRHQEQLLCQLAPHLQQAVSLARKMGQFREQAETLTQAVNQLSAGVVTVDVNGQVRWLNDHARQIVEQSRHLRLVGDRLRCSHRDDQMMLAELIQQAARIDGLAGDHPVATLGENWDNPLQILAMPVRQMDATAPGAGMSVFVALYLNEADAHFVLPERDVARLFGLTPAESRLAVALCDGTALNDYAEHQGISPGTARIQLKSVFAKVGVSRQQELVRLLCTSIAARTRHPL